MPCRSYLSELWNLHSFYMSCWNVQVDGRFSNMRSMPIRNVFLFCWCYRYVDVPTLPSRSGLWYTNDVQSKSKCSLPRRIFMWLCDGSLPPVRASCAWGLLFRSSNSPFQSTTKYLQTGVLLSSSFHRDDKLPRRNLLVAGWNAKCWSGEYISFVYYVSCRT